MIPKRFIRVWLGFALKPKIFDDWWFKFQEMHPSWEFLTIDNKFAQNLLPPTLEKVWKASRSYATQANIIRYVALRDIGGIYIDTDIMPIKNFSPLIDDPRPFAGKRSNSSFENAVIGSPPKHPAAVKLVENLDEHFWKFNQRTSPVGPIYFSDMWFGRDDVRHLPPKTFYPYNGFMGPSRAERIKQFKQKNFSNEMYAAHFSNHRWGGKPQL